MQALKYFSVAREEADGLVPVFDPTIDRQRAVQYLELKAGRPDLPQREPPPVRYHLVELVIPVKILQSK